MAITLGKDCTISVGGTLTGVRSVTLSQTARTIDIDEYGTRYASVYSTGRELSASIELNDDQSLSALIDSLENGTDITVAGGVGGFSFPAVVVGITENDSVDGVVTFTVEARLTRQGLRMP